MSYTINLGDRGTEIIEKPDKASTRETFEQLKNISLK